MLTLIHSIHCCIIGNFMIKFYCSHINGNMLLTTPIRATIAPVVTPYKDKYFILITYAQEIPEMFR